MHWDWPLLFQPLKKLAWLKHFLSQGALKQTLCVEIQCNQARFGYSCKQVELNERYNFAFNSLSISCSRDPVKNRGRQSFLYTSNFCGSFKPRRDFESGQRLEFLLWKSICLVGSRPML